MQKRLNPYRVATKEIIKFRGVNDEEASINMADEYVGNCNNMESFKIRTSTNRYGHSKDDQYEDTIINAKSIVTTKSVCEGTNIWAESRIDSFIPKVKAYPWREVKVGLNPDEILDRLSVRCKDLNVPIYSERAEGSEDLIVGSQDWKTCFTATCSTMWAAVGDVSGYKKTLENSASNINLAKIFSLSNDGCYQSTSGSLGDNLATPPQFNIITPEIPPFEDTYCKEELISSETPSGDTETIVLVEGYEEATVGTYAISTSLNSTKDFWSVANITFKATVNGGRDVAKLGLSSENLESDRAIYYDRNVSSTPAFICASYGGSALTIRVKEGFIGGDIIDGTITWNVLGEGGSKKIRIIVAKASYSYDVDVVANGTQGTRYVSFRGTFPTIVPETWYGANISTPPYQRIAKSYSSGHSLSAQSFGFSTGWRETGTEITDAKVTITMPDIGEAYSAIVHVDTTISTNSAKFVSSAEITNPYGKAYLGGWLNAGVRHKPTSYIGGEITSRAFPLEVAGNYEGGEQVSITLPAPSIPDSYPIAGDPVIGGGISNSVSISNVTVAIVG